MYCNERKASENAGRAISSRVLATRGGESSKPRLQSKLHREVDKLFPPLFDIRNVFAFVSATTGRRCSSFRSTWSSLISGAATEEKIIEEQEKPTKNLVGISQP